MDENHEGNNALESRHQKHPIVERPEWVDWRQIENRDLSGHDKAMGQRYIRHLEHNLSVTEKALSDAHSRLEAIYERHGPDVEVDPEQFICGWWCADYPCAWNCKGEICSRPTGPDPIWDEIDS